MEISIRRAVLSDAEVLIEIKKRAFAAEFALYGIQPPNFDSLEQQRKSIEGGCYFAICVDGRITGGSGVKDRGEGHYYLSSLYIDMPFQQKGIGWTALRLIEQSFPDARKWSLETPYLSRGNHYFYEKAGYRKTGEYSPECLL